jgi:hypothetical protein
MDITYVLIDLENLTPKDLALLSGDQYQVRVFHGHKQKSISMEAFSPLVQLGERAQLVPSPGEGSNALDFLIAFELGRLFHQHRIAETASPKKVEFVVLSDDKGYDALMSHITEKGFPARRAGSVREMLGLAKTQVSKTNTTPKVAAQPKPPAPAPAEIAAPLPSAAKPSAKQPGADRAADIKTLKANLQKHAASRPARRKTLEKHIPSLLGRQVSAEEAVALVHALEQHGFIKFDGAKVEYLTETSGAAPAK